MVATEVMHEGFAQDAPAFLAYVGASARSVERLDAARGRSEKRQALARFRAENRKSLMELKKQKRIVTRFLATIAKRDLTLEDFVSISDLAVEKKKIEQREMDPALERLREKLRTREAVWDEDALACFRESVDIAAGWLAAHRELTDKVLKMAAEAHARGKRTLTARPVKGTIDFVKLSREHIARYPKIRARLAE